MNKYRFILNRPDISSDDINKSKKFEKLLSEAKQNIAKKNKIKQSFILSSLFIIALTSIILFYFSSHKDITSIKTKILTSQLSTSINDLKLEYEYFYISPKKTNTIKTKNGSIITIPKNYFLSNNDSIKLIYRDFNSPIEFIFCKIPMVYDSNSTKYVFESAGMFEIDAIDQHKRAKTNNHKKITIQFPSLNNNPDFNFYNFDTILNNWKYIQNANINSNKTNNPTTYRYSDNTQTKQTLTKRLAIINDSINTHKQNEPTPPAKSNINNYRFNLDILQEEFPELAHYKSLEFEIKRAYQKFDNEIFKTRWLDAKLKHLKKDEYLLSLKSQKDKYDFIITPVYEGYTFDSLNLIYTEAYKKYKNIELQLIKDKKNIQTSYKKLYNTYQYNSQQIHAQIKEEKQLKKENETFLQTYLINQLGIYNCDKATAIQKNNPIHIRFIDSNKTRINPNKVYLIQKNFNGYFDISSLIINNYSNHNQYFIITLNKNGKIGYVTSKQLENLNKKVGPIILNICEIKQCNLTAENINKIAGFKVMRNKK